MRRHLSCCSDLWMRTHPISTSRFCTLQARRREVRIKINLLYRTKQGRKRNRPKRKFSNPMSNYQIVSPWKKAKSKTTSIKGSKLRVWPKGKVNKFSFPRAWPSMDSSRRARNMGLGISWTSTWIQWSVSSWRTSSLESDQLLYSYLLYTHQRYHRMEKRS